MQTMKEVDRTDTEVTYEYSTILSYVLYGTLFSWIFVIASDLPRWVELLFAGFIFLYLFVVYLPSRSRSKEIKEAMKVGTIEMTGSRWSFSNPLRITVRTANGRADSGK